MYYIFTISSRHMDEAASDADSGRKPSGPNCFRLCQLGYLARIIYNSGDNSSRDTFFTDQVLVALVQEWYCDAKSSRGSKRGFSAAGAPPFQRIPAMDYLF